MEPIHVEMNLTRSEWETLKDFFKCKNERELLLAAKRYQDLFFHFWYEEDGIEPRPDDVDCHMQLALAFADQIFTNLTETNKHLQYRHSAPVPGRRKSKDLPPDVIQQLEEAEKTTKTKLEAVKLLINRGRIDTKSNPEAVLRRIQKLQKQQRDRQLSLQEDFKDFDFTPYLDKTDEELSPVPDIELD